MTLLASGAQRDDALPPAGRTPSPSRCGSSKVLPRRPNGAWAHQDVREHIARLRPHFGHFGHSVITHDRIRKHSTPSSRLLNQMSSYAETRAAARS